MYDVGGTLHGRELFRATSVQNSKPPVTKTLTGAAYGNGHPRRRNPQMTNQVSMP